MKTPLLLVGGGGHCRNCIDVIEAGSCFSVAGIVERPGAAGLSGIDYPLLGSDDDLPKLTAQYPLALVTVGQIKNWQLRVRLFDNLRGLGATFPVVVSPHAYCSPRANISAGTIVMHAAVVNPQARVGENCIINCQTLIDHDAVVEAHCHISTGAKLNGAVHVEEACFIGSGAVIREGVRIGARSIVGAGAVVLHDVPAGTTFRRGQ